MSHRVGSITCFAARDALGSEPGIDIDLEDAFDLPPVRLPEEAELATQAREYTFAVVLDTTLEAADDSDPVIAHDLDLEGHGPALVTRLFLSRQDGVRVMELADALKDAATADLEADEAGRQWQAWVDAHGDPLRVLVGNMPTSVLSTNSGNSP